MKTQAVQVLSANRAINLSWVSVPKPPGPPGWAITKKFVDDVRYTRPQNGEVLMTEKRI
jgi:hypothetical protein